MEDNQTKLLEQNTCKSKYKSDRSEQNSDRSNNQYNKMVTKIKNVSKNK